MRYDPTALKKFGLNVMKKAGLGEKEADIFMDALIYADLRGISSHGVSRLRTYAARVSAGVIAANTTPEILADFGGTLVIDGKNGIGASIARQSMEFCIDRARKFGCCFATVRHANHFGTGAYFTDYAARHQMIGFVVSNSEAAVVPVGGSVPMLGTNPLSLSIPAEKHQPFILDMATSTVARGKVVLAKKEGRKIPVGWGVDKNGDSTVDPDQILNGGAMLPFGGAKGYGISMAIDILCSCLAGSLNCRQTYHFWDDLKHPQDIGYFIGAIDVSKFLPFNEFGKKVDALLDEFKNCPPSPGVKSVMIPGEIEFNNYINGLHQGLELSDAIIKDLKSVGSEYGIAPNF